MRSVVATLPALLALTACVTAPAPGDDYLRGGIAEPDFPAEAPFSLITGRLVRERALGSFPCPSGSICLATVWEDAIDDLDTHLGPTIDPGRRIRSVHDPELLRNRIVAYIVRPDDAGQLWAVDIQFVAGDRACFGGWVAEKWSEFASDRRTERSGEEVCFPVN